MAHCDLGREGLRQGGSHGGGGVGHSWCPGSPVGVRRPGCGPSGGLLSPVRRRGDGVGQLGMRAGKGRPRLGQGGPHSEAVGGRGRHTGSEAGKSAGHLDRAAGHRVRAGALWAVGRNVSSILRSSLRPTGEVWLHLRKM